jgi:hypothetical protein
LARILQIVFGMLAMYLPLSAAADDRVLLQEVMPELAGTPLGAVDLGPAPVPGTTLTVRRSDVQRALAQAGLTDNHLTIPRATKITRALVEVSHDELAAEALEAVTDAVSPCELRDARYPNTLRLATGPRSFHAEFMSLHSGSVSGGVFVESGGRSVRVPVVASLSCPPPEVKPGAQVTAVAIVGPVKATAPAEARQPGRRGDIIRITNRATGASLRGRIIDAHTVEVMP